MIRWVKSLLCFQEDWGDRLWNNTSWGLADRAGGWIRSGSSQGPKSKAQ